MKTQAESLFKSPKKQETNEIFEHVKIDNISNHNHLIQNIVKEKRSQILSIMDSLGMQKYSEKYNPDSSRKILKKKMYSKPKISHLKKEKSEYPPIKINNLDTNSKDSENNFKKNKVDSRNNMNFISSDLTITKKFFNKSDSNVANLLPMNNIHPIKPLYSNLVDNENSDNNEQLKLSSRRSLNKSLTKIRTFTNINDFFAKSLFKQDLKLTDNHNINRNINQGLVNKMFDNCFENGKNIDFDFKQTIKSQSKIINHSNNIISNSQEKGKELNKVIPLDMNIFNDQKSNYIYIGGKKFDFDSDGIKDDYYSGLDKLTNMSPNLAYNFRFEFIKKYKLNNKEGLPIDFKSKKVIKNKTKDGLHNQIDNLLRKSEMNKGRILRKLLER